MATSDSPQTAIYRQQHAGRGTTMIVDEAGVLDITSGTLKLPGNLRRGYIPLNLFAGRARTTATASGSVALADNTQPALVAVSATDAKYVQVIRWTSGGTSNPLVLGAIGLPPDYATAGGLTVSLYGRRSSANTSFDLRASVFQNISSADLGATIGLTSALAQQSITVASGSIASTGLVTVMLAGNATTTGLVELYSGQLLYTRTTS